MTNERTIRETPALTASLRSIAQAARELSAGVSAVRQAGLLTRQRRTSANCSDGSCSVSGSSGGGSGGGGAGGGSGGSGLFAAPLAAFGNAILRSSLSSMGGGSFDLGGALRQSLASSLRSMIGGLSRSLTGALGGGAGGSLLGGLFGAGLSALAGGLLGRLFHKRQAVEPRALDELLNFPQLSSLDFASNPASRLFGGRAVARGPAFSVEVNYRGGAEDLVTAKVASKLLDLNSMRGIV